MKIIFLQNTVRKNSHICHSKPFVGERRFAALVSMYTPLAFSCDNRLIRAGARMATMHEGSGRNGGGGDEPNFTHQVEEMADLHLTLSRALLLQGAFGEADDHARASSRLTTTTTTRTTIATVQEKFQEEDGVAGDVDAANAAVADTAETAALHLEIELLSRTPVVLATAESATLLRGELLRELGSLRNQGTGFGVSIPNPLEVGVRAQFLAAYQVKQFFGCDGGGR